MKFFLIVSLLLAICCQYVEAKHVFAHFMVTNTALFTHDDWTNNIRLAQEAKIDGFAMNMATGDGTNDIQLPKAFEIARNLGFKLFFSFDYASNGLWPKNEVLKYITTWSGDSAYFRDPPTNRVLVSTFEGPAVSNDWHDIKAKTNCYFIPSWNSITPAAAISKGLANGLFNWDAWPEGKNQMFTTLDIEFKNALAANKRPYMMPISPWFFTNMPGYRKNWVWKGESVWYDRWNQIFALQPEYVQILSWNDFGESHYIGPLDDRQYTAFDQDHGKSPYNYAKDMPHDGWRSMLPYVIEMYKNGQSTITKEKLNVWYRRSSNIAPLCSTAGTTGNTASKLQNLYGPSEVLKDRVYFSALLGSTATFTVSIGGVHATDLNWDRVPVGGVGIYQGSVVFTTKSVGEVWVTIYRNGVKVLQLGSPGIKLDCPLGIKNYNAYVRSLTATATINATPLNIAQSVCVEGTGPGKYADMCKHSCKYAYCPSVCTCTMMGPAIPLPPPDNRDACPKAGVDSTFGGLCSFNCNRGNCNANYCTVVPNGQGCPPAPAPVTPPSNKCKAGTALGEYAPTCEFTCQFGFCPPEICYCTSAGLTTGTAPAYNGVVGRPSYGFDYGLCEWACGRGFCQSPCTTGVSKRDHRHKMH